jgi:hypothetical protein
MDSTCFGQKPTGRKTFCQFTNNIRRRPVNSAIDMSAQHCVGQLNVGQMSAFHMSSNKTFIGQMPFGQIAFSQMPFGQIAFSQMPFGQIAFSQMPFGQIAFSQI